MKYRFHCDVHGEFLIQASIHDGPPTEVTCSVCGVVAQRKYEAIREHWNCQGAHRTDYDDQGDKVERLNRTWSKHLGGIKPPPPASSVPRNSSEPY